MFGYLFGQITSTPIYSQNKQTKIDLNPAIVVTKPSQPILYDNDQAIVPPPPPPAPPGPIDEIYSVNDTIIEPHFPEEAIVPPPPPPSPPGPLYTKIILPDGAVLYTPMDIRPFLI